MDQEKRVRHLRQVLLWPVYLLPLDEGAPQTAFLFPERDERQASIVEIPVTQDDVKKSTPRAHAWLRHYQVSLKLRLAQGEIVANIHPYDDNLRRVFDGCTP